MRTGAWILISLCVGAVFWNGVVAQVNARAACDRECLVGIASRYTAALVGHVPKSLPVTPDVKFTENLVPLKFGEQGLWKTVSGRRDFNIYAADVGAGNVVWIGIVKENDKAVMMTARLKVVDRRITELETLVGRSALTRIWAVDVEHGLVVGLFTPNVPGNVRQIKLRGGKVLDADASELLPFTIQQVEMFKIVGGQISKVEVVLGPRVPYGMRSPFDMRTLWDPR